MGNTNKNPFSKSYSWYESEQVSGCFLSHRYQYSIFSGFQMSGKGNNQRESPSSSASSSEDQKLPTKLKLAIQEGDHPIWLFYVNEERNMMYECLEIDDQKEINQNHVFDLVKEGQGDLLAEFHVLSKIVQIVTNNQYGLSFSNPHHSTILLTRQILTTNGQLNEQVASFNKQDDRKLGASSFNGTYGNQSMYESEVFCSDLDRVYLNFVMRKVEEIIKDEKKH